MTCGIGLWCLVSAEKAEPHVFENIDGSPVVTSDHLRHSTWSLCITASTAGISKVEKAAPDRQSTSSACINEPSCWEEVSETVVDILGALLAVAVSVAAFNLPSIICMRCGTADLGRVAPAKHHR